jgi:LmbE family N-acetylglucosaminyl deacetylase
MSGMKILVVGAHPDDEVMGAGGTILKHVKQKDDAYLCIVTKAYTPDWTEAIIKQKRQEAIKASKILGIKKTYFCDLPTVMLDTIPQKELNKRIADVVSEVQPDIVYTTHRGDLNSDHRLVFESTMVAVRPTVAKSVSKVLSYELPSSTDWAPPFPERTFIPNVYVDISDVLETKIKAMSVYRTELKGHPHPRSLEAIAIYAKRRGMEIQVEAAEAFMLIREIIKD